MSPVSPFTWARPTISTGLAICSLCKWMREKLSVFFQWRCLMRIEHTSNQTTHFHAQTLKVITDKGDTQIQTRSAETGGQVGAELFLLFIKEHNPTAVHFFQPLPPPGPVLHSVYHIALSCPDGGYIWGEATLRRDEDDQLVFCQLPYVALRRSYC